MSVSEINQILTGHKDEGNKEFKDKVYMMAISHFTAGINVYMKHKDMVHQNKDLLTRVTQLYTNRALSFSNLGNQADAFTDSDYVLQNLDPQNAKALFRRATCYKQRSQTTLAIKDLEVLCKIEPNNVHAKKDLKELQAQVNKEKTTKIQEVNVET